MANNQVTLLRYTDPERKNLAHAAAVYLGKSDTDNIKRPVGIMKKRHTLAIFRGESARFEFETSKVAYDHLITYTTADMRAAAGLRANEAHEFMPPAEDIDDPIYKHLGEESLRNYKALINGIDPETEDPQKKKRLQAARSVLPMSTKIRYIFQFNFLTLITIFQQRIWTPGAQEDTKQVVQIMWEIVRSQDPDLWDAVKEEFGPEEQSWIKARKSLKRKDPDLYRQIMDEHGKMRSMWD